MRMIMDPFEAQFSVLNGSSESGWTVSGADMEYLAPVTDFNGNGGAVSVGRSATVTLALIESPAFEMNIVEGVVKWHWYRGTATVARMNLVDSTGAVSLNVRGFNGTGNVGIYRGNILLSSTVLGAAPTAQWMLCELKFRHLNSGGMADLYIDGTLVATFSGDTQHGTTSLVSRIQFANWNSDNRFDNVAVNAPVLKYDGGSSGVPTVTETITGGTSGATAIAAAANPAATGTAGYVSVYDWDGTAFQNNETITSTSMTAVVDAPTSDYVDGFTPHSFFHGNEHFVAMTPNANGNSSGLVGSDGNSVDNYLLVNDVPPATADYVENTTSGPSTALQDTYGVSATNVPATADMNADEVTSVAVVAYVQSDLTGVDNMRHIVRQGSTDYYHRLTQGLPLSAAARMAVFDTQPDGSGAWTRAAAVGAEYGAELGP